MEERSERQAIGHRIRSLRRGLEMSLQQLADRAGISPGYLSEVERGSSAPSGEKLGRIANELGTTTDYLLTGRKDQPAVQIPAALAAAAEQLDLTYAQTIRLLTGKLSLVARRSSAGEDEWTEAEWMSFYNKVKPYL